MAIYVRQLEAIQITASRIASALGHLLTAWEPGSDAWSSAATCTECGLYAVASSQDTDGPIYGSTTEVQCRGALTIPSWGPPASGGTAPVLSMDVLVIVAADQGACPDGHPCHLTPDESGKVARTCGVRGSRQTHMADDRTYVGLPLINLGATQAQIDAARVIDPELADWAESYVRPIIVEPTVPRIPPRTN